MKYDLMDIKQDFFYLTVKRTKGLSEEEIEDLAHEIVNDGDEIFLLDHFRTLCPFPFVSHKENGFNWYYILSGSELKSKLYIKPELLE